MIKVLYKAKDKDSGEWVEGYYIAFPDIDKHFICGWCLEEDEPYSYEIDPSTLCQYTWFADGSGKKVCATDTARGDLISRSELLVSA